MKYVLDKPVTVSIGIQKYACVVEWRNGEFIVDEPEKSGGGDKGPDPMTLLLSALGSCTAATLKMYIDRKGWDIPNITVALNMYHEIKGDHTITVIDREINFKSIVTDEQRDRLIQIAKVCPISKMLEGEIKITAVAENDD